MPEFAVTFIGIVQAPDRLAAWQKARVLATEADLLIVKVSEIEPRDDAELNALRKEAIAQATLKASL